MFLSLAVFGFLSLKYITCTSDDGYNYDVEGEKSQESIFDCSRCTNGATCTGEKCDCPLNYTGFFCEEDVDECSFLICPGNATCVNMIGGYSCTCPEGFVGENCSDENAEEDYDECQSGHCENGATCVNTVGSYNCICQAGFTGLDCDQDLNECEQEVCKNGADCTNEFGSYICNCTTGYQGLNCTEDVDECLLEICNNGATCENRVGGYACACADNYTGLSCDISMATLCQDGWTGFCANSSCSCYKFFKELSTLFVSNSTCHAHASQLASIHSVAENDFVWNLATDQTERLWIGLNDISVENEFQWTDGSDVDFRKFYGKNPNNYKDREDCVHMGPAGVSWNLDSLWNDNNCLNRGFFVCKSDVVLKTEGV